jgi:hypothetical protein
MQVALAALMAHGYRPGTKRPGHHVTVLQGLTLTIDLAAARVRVLDTLRRRADRKFERAQRGRAARSVAMASRPCDSLALREAAGRPLPAYVIPSVPTEAGGRTTATGQRRIRQGQQRSYAPLVATTRDRDR